MTGNEIFIYACRVLVAFSCLAVLIVFLVRFYGTEHKDK